MLCLCSDQRRVPLAANTSRTPGYVVMEAPARSAAALVYRRTLALFLRESSM